MSGKKILLMRPGNDQVFRKVLRKITSLYPGSALTILELKIHSPGIPFEKSFNKIVYPVEFPYFSPFRCGMKFMSELRKKRFDLIVFVFESAVISQFTNTLLFALFSGADKRLAVGPGEKIREFSKFSVVVRLIRNFGVKSLTFVLSCVCYPFAVAVFSPVFVARRLLLKKRSVEIYTKYT